MKARGKESNNRTIMVGDMNARHRSWGITSSTAGKVVITYARETNSMFSVPQEPSYKAKGRQGHRNPDQMLDWEQAVTTQPGARYGVRRHTTLPSSIE